MIIAWRVRMRNQGATRVRTRFPALPADRDASVLGLDPFILPPLLQHSLSGLSSSQQSTTARNRNYSSPTSQLSSPTILISRKFPHPGPHFQRTIRITPGNKYIAPIGKLITPLTHTLTHPLPRLYHTSDGQAADMKL